MTHEQRRQIALPETPELIPLDNGHAVLTGSLARLERALDAQFRDWAKLHDAMECSFPGVIDAKELSKIGYFHSFPLHASFPVTLDDTMKNLHAFTSGDPVNVDGHVQLTELSPTAQLLTPAACYHAYVCFQGMSIEEPMYLTTRATCFRREIEYSPLARQWCFTMREIICIGTKDEVERFLDFYRTLLTNFFKRIDVPMSWNHATDSFFDPSHNPNYIMQKLSPLKFEMTTDYGLPIGSSNFHRNHFGVSFDFSCGGEPAYSGCIAFGIERWILAILKRFGADEKDWPKLD